MNQLVLLAKQAVESYIEDKKVIPVPAASKGGEPRLAGRESFPKDFLQKRAGVFVTIEKEKRLRGCIGTYLPVRENIGEEIIHNAIAAATEDWRFGPVKKTELPRLLYTVYILNKPEKVEDISELDPKKFGIILKSQGKSGLLLPDLEGVNTITEQIAICCQKGGIYLKDKNLEIYKFTVEKYAQQHD